MSCLLVRLSLAVREILLHGDLSVKIFKYFGVRMWNLKRKPSICYKGTVCRRLSLEEYGQQEELLNAELQRSRQRSMEVNQEMGQVLEELGNARLYTHESRRQLQRKEMREKLHRLYPESVVRDQLISLKSYCIIHFLLNLVFRELAVNSHK